MLKTLKTLILGATLLGISTSCDGTLPQYEVVKRCTIDIDFSLCECALYDFNIPKAISKYESVPINECLDGKIIQTFAIEDWAKIVITRKERKYIEDAENKRDLVRRVRSISP